MPLEADVKHRLKKFYGGASIPKQWATELATKVKDLYSFEAVARIYSSLFDEHLKAAQ